jgi:Na+-transporting NADH:ubiquinone oxidoreductase subunit C
MNKESMVFTIVFTVVAAFVFVFILALANETTKERVEENAALARQSAILNAMGLPFSADTIETIYKDVSIIEEGEYTLYSFGEGESRIYAKVFSGSGLWGTITGVLSVKGTMAEIAGLEIISHNETPGLGGRIDEEWFKVQFKGEKVLPGGIEVNQKGSGEGDPVSDNGIVDGITGASRTSQSMETIINRELNILSEVLGGRNE